MLFPMNGGLSMRTSAVQSHAIVSPALAAHALTAWAMSAVLLLVLDVFFHPWVASAFFTLVAPGVSALVAARYFLHHGADEALTAAIWFTATALTLDLLLERALPRRELVDPAFGFGLPLILVFGVTGLVGEILPLRRQHRSG